MLELGLIADEDGAAAFFEDTAHYRGLAVKTAKAIA
jgi:hypothetical protein